MRKSCTLGNRKVIYDAVPEGKDIWIDVIQVQENGRRVDISYGQEQNLAYILQGMEIAKHGNSLSGLFERLGNAVSSNYWRGRA